MAITRMVRLALLAISVIAALALYASPAMASGPPIVTTGSASGFTLNTAQISGTVDGNGDPWTKYKVEYGPTTSYGSSTPSIQLSGEGVVPLDVKLVGLEPKASYHFRVSATNEFGTSIGEDGQFEMSKSWKVEGVPISELPPVTFKTYEPWEYPGVQGNIELSGPITSSIVKVRCWNDEALFGTLGADLGTINYDASCVTWVNGVEKPLCKLVNGITMYLNGAFAQSSKTRLDFPGATCALPDFNLQEGGFGATAPGEYEKQFLGMKGVMYGAAKPWSTWWSTNQLWLTGANTGDKFGIL